MEVLLENGLILGPFQLERRLGKGGMGEVFLATLNEPLYELERGSRVAVKILRTDLLDDATMIRRFQREAMLGSNLNHKNLVRTFALEEIDFKGQSLIVLVMQFIEGRTLEEECGGNALETEHAMSIASAVLLGLKELHSIGVVHRDVKPENIMLDSGGNVLLMDFGLAKFLESKFTRLTKSSAFLGTLDFAAPEQLDSKKIDHRTDLYSLGAVMYEMITGKPPFTIPDNYAKITSILKETPRRPSFINPDIPFWLEELVLSLLEKTKEARPQTCNEVLQQIQQGLERSEAEEVELPPFRQAVERILAISQLEIDTPFVGREKELSRLQDALKNVDGNSGRAILIKGESGIGKTRLLFEGLAGLEVESAGYRLGYSHCMYHTLQTSMAPIVSAFRFLLGLGADSEARESTERISESLAPLLPTQRRSVLPFSQILIGSAAGFDEDVSPDQLFQILIELLRSLRQSSPVVLAIDGVQWADEVSLRFLSRLFQEIRTLPILLLLTQRSLSSQPDNARDSTPLMGEILSEAELHGDLQCIELKRLQPRDVDEITSYVLTKDFHSMNLAKKLYRESDGIPWLVFEILRLLRESGNFVKHEGFFKLRRDFSEPEIPGTIEQLFQRRLEHLSEEHRELLELASVQGDSFNPKLLAGVTDESYITVLKQLKKLGKSGRLVLPLAEGGFRFEHHQLYEAIYNGIPSELKKEYHALYAENLLTEKDVESAGSTKPALIYHLQRAGRWRDALESLPETLTLMKQQGRLFEALDLARAVRAGGARASLNTQLLSRYIDALLEEQEIQHLLGNKPGQLIAIREALKVSRADGLAAEATKAYNRLSVFYRHLGKLEKAAATAEKALLMAQENELTKEAAYSLNAMGNIRRHQDRFEDALELYLQAEPLLSGHDPSPSLGDLLCNIGITQVDLGLLEEGNDYLQRTIQFARARGYNDLEVHSILTSGRVKLMLGDFDEALTLMMEGLNSTLEMNNRLLEAWARSNLGSLHRTTGNFDAAGFYLTAGREIYSQVGYRAFDVSCALELAHVHLLTWNFTEFCPLIEEMRNFLEGEGEPEPRAQLHFLEAPWEWMLGNSEGMQEHLGKIDEVTSEIRAHWVTELKLNTGLLKSRSGLFREAEEDYCYVSSLPNFKSNRLLRLRVEFGRYILKFTESTTSRSLKAGMLQTMLDLKGRLLSFGLKHEAVSVALSGIRCALELMDAEFARDLLTVLEEEIEQQDLPVPTLLPLLCLKAELLEALGEPAAAKDLREEAETEHARLAVAIPDKKARSAFLAAGIENLRY